MTLFAPLDDLLVTTLSALPGLMTKVDYLSSLKQDGAYVHWGFARRYGETAAQQALAEAHTMLISEVLRTPLRRLLEEIQTCSLAQERPSPVLYLDQLSRRTESLLPTEVGGGSSRHFSSVLRALSALARAQPPATHPDA